MHSPIPEVVGAAASSLSINISSVIGWNMFKVLDPQACQRFIVDPDVATRSGTRCIVALRGSSRLSLDPNADPTRVRHVTRLRAGGVSGACGQVRSRRCSFALSC